MDELAPDDASATTLRPGAPSEGPVLGPSTRVMCRASPGARALHDAQQGPEVFRPACWRASGQWVIGGRGMHGGVPCVTPPTVRTARGGGLQHVGRHERPSARPPCRASTARYPLPSYLPEIIRDTRMAHWAQQHVATVATRYRLGPDDLWDEAITALIRAAAYYQPAAGPFGPYAATAVHRACWRYVVRGHQSRPILVPLEETAGCLELTATSAEAEALARETASRAWILLQHAALADTRGDHDTTTRLLDAAAAATRAARRQPPATPTSGA